MPSVISSTVLRNNYNSVSEQCRASAEPIYVTKNGCGDLAVMGIESYEQLKSRLDMYEFLMQGRRDADTGRVMPATQATNSIREELGL